MICKLIPVRDAVTETDVFLIDVHVKVVICMFSFWVPLQEYMLTS